MPTAINALDNTNKAAGRIAFMGAKMYHAGAHGGVDESNADNRTEIQTVLTLALANLPAVIDFGPGVFDISNGIPVDIPQGSGGLLIRGVPGLTTINFDGASAWNSYFAFDIRPTVTPTVGDYANYIHNVRIDGILFHDADPSTHAGGDQTHGVSIGYCLNTAVIDCGFEDIGDEAITLKHCRGGEIRGINTKNVPALGTDAGAITIQHGSAGINIDEIHLKGSATEGTQSVISGSVGIHIEIVSANDVEDITIGTGTIKDFADAAIQFNNAAAGDIDGVTIGRIIARNCADGIKKRGTAGTTRDLNCLGTVIKDMSNIGMNFDAGKTNTEDLVLTNCTINNCTVAGMKLQVTGAELSNNKFKSCERGIHIFNGDEINIIGGTFKSCGGSLREEIEVETGTDVTAKGVKILNSQSTSACIKGVQTVEGCEIEAAGAINQENRIFGVTRAINNKVNGGIRFAGVANVVAEGNELGWNDTGSANSTPALLVAAANDNARIQNNTIDMSGSTNNQYCVDIASGASGTLVVGNILKSLTAGQANAFNDNGTGTVADFTNNNTST